MKPRLIFFLFFILPFFNGCNPENDRSASVTNEEGPQLAEASNPFIPGYFANPSIIQHDDRFYVFATIDSWGGFELAVWESADFRQWTLRRLNWPTIRQCTSSTADQSMISAPSVVQADDDKFYMYVTSGSEIWAGTSEHPLGPWYQLTPEGTPLIRNTPEKGFHVYGAECFVDDDGQAYLYWGSGQNWQDGKCLAAKLGSDMCSFLTDPLEVTPPNYLEAPFVVKYKGKYHMFYSNGRGTDSTYHVRYACSDSPLGPWTEGVNSPLLTSRKDAALNGPGHPAIFEYNGQLSILYHKIFESKGHSLLRQLCINSLAYGPGNEFRVKSEEDDGISLKAKNRQGTGGNIPLTEASSELSADYPAAAATDGLYGTLWAPADNDGSPSLNIDLREVRKIRDVFIWPEYPLQVYQYLIEYSRDNSRWKEFSDAMDNQDRGAPRFESKFIRARYLRITFFRGGITECRPAVWEIEID